MNKVIVITGSSTGIGKTLAEHLSAQGHTVYGLSRKDIQNPQFQTVPTDITQKAEIASALSYILEKEKRVDVLINNAGMGMVGAIEDAQKNEIQNLFALNLIGTVEMISAVLPSMRERKTGQIINISSIGSEMGLPFRGFYSASKAAVDRVTEAIRYEVRPWNVQICSLHLGDIQTNIADSRVKSSVSKPYEELFNKVYGLMNTHVDKGSTTLEVAQYIESLLQKKNWKAHYYFGKLGQRIGVPLKWLLPQNFYETLMRKYNKIE
ncbi:SDR family oxidoreductase [Chryseobacterium sp. A301]